LCAPLTAALRYVVVVAGLESERAYDARAGGLEDFELELVAVRRCSFGPERFDDQRGR
jgi:hypothetical protein